MRALTHRGGGGILRSADQRPKAWLVDGSDVGAGAALEWQTRGVEIVKSQVKSERSNVARERVNANVQTYSDQTRRVGQLRLVQARARPSLYFK